MVLDDVNAVRFQLHNQTREIIYKQRWMSLARRTEVRLDTEMNLQGTAFKPCAAAFRQVRRLGYLGYSKQAFIERSGCVFHSRRHGKLYVINGHYWHGLTLAPHVRVEPHAAV